MTMVYSVAAQKQISNHAPISNSPKGFCVDLSPTVAASLQNRPSLTPAPGSAALLGKPVIFGPSRSLPLDESIREKFKNMHNSTVLLSEMKTRGDQICDKNVLKYCIFGDFSVAKMPVGLSNKSNYCYLNSVLQCLLATGPLMTFIFEKHNFIECPLTGRKEFCSLCGLHRLGKLQSKDVSLNMFHVISPDYFIFNLGKIGRYDHNRQEDAQEFLSGMLSNMETCVNIAEGTNSCSESRFNIIRRIFYGSSIFEDTCRSCRNVTRTEEIWSHLHLNIQNCRSLQEILSNYGSPEIIDEYKCSNCHRYASAVRTHALIKAPPVLIVHLLRFEDGHKIDAYIKFPLSFDLRPYMSSRHSNAVNYKLFAIINHRGSDTKSGHYVACTNRRGVWFEHSDTIITQINSKRVLEQKPYVLLYKLVNPEEALCFPVTANMVKEEPGPSSKPISLDPVICSNSSSSQNQPKLGVFARSPSHPAVIDSRHSVKHVSAVSSVPVMPKLGERVSPVSGTTVTPTGLIRHTPQDKFGKDNLSRKRPYPNISACPVPFKIRRNDTAFESRHHKHWHKKFGGRRHRHHRHYEHGSHWY